MSEYIDWDNLSNEMKESFFKQIKNEATVNENVKHPASTHFKEHGWVHIKGFLDETMCNYFYHYIQLESKRALTVEQIDGLDYDTDRFGTFTDTQVPGDFSQYGDMAFDTLLSLGLEKMEIFTNLKLVPTYSYHRLYTKQSELKRHRDRPSCEISTTISLGADVSNLGKKEQDYIWPIHIEDEKGPPIGLKLEKGDMLIYRGCDLFHWREPLKAYNHAQVFLHYNEKDKDNDNLFDGRPALGMAPLNKNDDNKIKNEIEGDPNTQVREDAFVVE